MKTIQIPSGIGIDGGGNCVRVPHLCKVKIEFGAPGVFSRSADGDDFSPELPNYQIDAWQTFVCSAPPYDVKVSWTFTPLDTSQPPVRGTILVDDKGSCTDTFSVPCPDSTS